MQALSIKNLTKTYRNGVLALKGIDLDVNEGDFFALLGPNGAGKTTLIGIITSLVNKTAGQVSVFDQDMAENLNTVKSYIGLVPQEFNFNIFEQVIQIVVNAGGFYGVPRELAYQRAEKYLKALELWGKRFTPAQMLSGGMKRRLMIARALIHEPKLLILDEPSAGIDVENRHSMWRFLREINQQGTTIILTTHNLEEAENLCNNIAIIHQGAIIENTSLNNLLSKLPVETFVFYLSEPITQLPIFNEFSARLIDAKTVEIDLEGDQSMSKIFTELSKHHIQVLRMRNKINRLEQLFLHLTQKIDAWR
jgi:ABC-2 type transport system ATP-binding protein